MNQEPGADTTAIQTARSAWLLALGGFLPFAGLSLFLLIAGSENAMFQPVLELFRVWSAMILSFLGGIRWGLALQQAPPDHKSLVFSVLPSIAAWFSLLLAPAYSIMVLLVLFCAHGAWDSFAVSAGKAPAWFGKLRMVLSVLVAIAHIVVVFAL